MSLAPGTTTLVIVRSRGAGAAPGRALPGLAGTDRVLAGRGISGRGLSGIESGRWPPHLSLTRERQLMRTGASGTFPCYRARGQELAAVEAHRTDPGA